VALSVRAGGSETRIHSLPLLPCRGIFQLARGRGTFSKMTLPSRDRIPFWDPKLDPNDLKSECARQLRTTTSLARG
jgi:hypothetical protein